MAPGLRRLAALSLLTLLVGCDHVTKVAAKAGLEGQHPRQVIRGLLDLHYVQNTDTAFNLLRWVPDGVRQPALIVAGALALLALLIALLWRFPPRPLMRAALLLITAGAIGNFADRILRGYVVDFMHLRHWPVFNVADIYVTAGVALFAWASLQRTRPDPDGGQT